MESIILLALIFGLIAYLKLKDYFLKAKQNKLVKEDQVLIEKNKKLTEEIIQKREELKKVGKKMTKEEILDFWNKG